MKDTNYINIQGWMVNRLGLKGNALVLFAAIYGFSQDEESEYKGALSYIADSLKVARRTATNVLDKLIEQGYIIKIEDPAGNRFKHNAEYINQILGGAKIALVQNVPTSSAEIAPIPSAKVAHNNSLDNNSNNDSTLSKNQKEKNQAKKTIFANSVCTDIDYVRSQLLKNKDHVDKYKGVDLKFYMDRVETWNDKGGKKTTARGWMAYIRQFMSSDIETGKLVMRERITAKKQVVPEEAMKQGVHANF